MARGFLNGALTGVFVSALGLGSWSLLTPQQPSDGMAPAGMGKTVVPTGTQVSKAVPTGTQVSKAAPTDTDVSKAAETAPRSAESNAAETAPEAAPAPQVPTGDTKTAEAPAAPQPKPERQADAQTTKAQDTASEGAAAQGAESEGAESEAPTAVAAGGDVASASDAKLSPGPDSQPEVAQPAPPDLTAEKRAEAGAAPQPEAPVTESAVSDAPALGAPQSAAGPAPKFITAPSKLRIESTAPAAPGAAVVADAAPRGPVNGEAAPKAPMDAARPAAPAGQEAGTDAVSTRSAPPPQPRVVQLGDEDAQGSAQPSGGDIGKGTAQATGLAPKPGFDRIANAPQPGFNHQVNGVVVGGLPTIGSAAQQAGGTDADPALTPDPGQKTLSVADAALPPVKRFAAPFTNPAQKPVLSIILIDTGGTLDRAKLAALPLEITFAIDPTRPGAAMAARAYRAAGHEVLILAPAIPAKATPAEVKTLLAGYRKTLPEAVGMLDAAQGGFETNPGLSQDVVSELSSDGLGLVTYGQGLDAANRVAQTLDVPAARVYRKLDAQDEGPFTMVRYLDRAAFRAAQEGRVVVVGHTRPDTIEALKQWAGDSRARTLAIGPVTAALSP